MKHQFCSEWTEVAAVPLALNGRFESRDADKGGGESPHTTDVAIAYELTWYHVTVYEGMVHARRDLHCV